MTGTTCGGGFLTHSRYCCRLYCPLFDPLGYSQVISRLAHWLCETRRTIEERVKPQRRTSQAVCGPNRERHSEVDQYDVIPERGGGNRLSGKGNRNVLASSLRWNRGGTRDLPHLAEQTGRSWFAFHQQRFSIRMPRRLIV